MERAIISKGNVQLESDDVEKAVFDVQALVDKYGGEVTDRETNTDDEGDVRMARLVLRIPAKKFSDAFGELEQVADLKSSSSTSEDVTTKVIDNAVRIRAQRRSLRRIEILLDQAVSIRDIVAIESQLTRRQADLDSLEQQQAFLRDQTSMSTVTVNIQLTPDEPPRRRRRRTTTPASSPGSRTASTRWSSSPSAWRPSIGALLPWAIVLLLVGGPLWLLIRRLRRREPPCPATDRVESSRR